MRYPPAKKSPLRTACSALMGRPRFPSHPQPTNQSDVYTPRGVNEESNLPVLVWFPGGNFDKVP